MIHNTQVDGGEMGITDLMTTEKQCCKKAQQELCSLFNKYACIKNDKWYLDWKKERGLD